LRRRTGQDENPLLSPEFFLGRVCLFPGNEPVVLLARAAGRLEGAVYLYEKLFWGMPTGYLRGFDHLTGESTVIADERDRVSLLQAAMQHLLLKTPARVAWATVRQGQGGGSNAVSIKPRGLISRAEVSSLRREHRLKLSNTFAATLARFGPPHPQKSSLLPSSRRKGIESGI
jgi:hypothetical protein